MVVHHPANQQQQEEKYQISYKKYNFTLAEFCRFKHRRPIHVIIVLGGLTIICFIVLLRIRLENGRWLCFLVRFSHVQWVLLGLKISKLWLSLIDYHQKIKFLAKHSNFQLFFTCRRSPQKTRRRLIFYNQWNVLIFREHAISFR